MRFNYLSRQDMKIILHYLGILMEGIGFILLIPVLVDFYYYEFIYPNGIISPLISIGLGFMLYEKFKQYDKLKFKHSMIISSLAWLWAGFTAAIIMVLVIDISFLDAFFENISAWTGSGLTLISDVESLPHSILFLRSLEQWVGGLGVVIVFIGALIKPGTSAYRLYRSEARDEKIKPNIRNTLRNTIRIYVFYTALGIVLYYLAGLPLFDSVNLTFTTISTGGMSIKNANIGFYHNNIIYLITMFIMILGATSFTVHYRMIKTRGKSLIKDIQFQFMIIAVIISGLLIMHIANLAPIDAMFHVISAITTTGANIASPDDMVGWAPSALIIIMILMAMGGSSSSTVGAIKLVRVITFLKGIHLTVKNLITPMRVETTKINNKKLGETEIKEASTYIAVYLFFLIVAWIILTFYTNDPIMTLFDVTSTIGNVGLSTGIVNGSLDPFPKLVLIFLMWLGRLEIIPILLTIRLGFGTFGQSLKLVKRTIRKRI